MRRSVVLLLSVLLAAGMMLAPPASADEVPLPSVAWDATTKTGYVGSEVNVSGTYADAPETAVLQIVDADDQQVVVPDVPKHDGRFVVPIRAEVGHLRLQAILTVGSDAVAASGVMKVFGKPAPVALTLSMPSAAKDYRSVRARVRMTARGAATATGTVRLQFRRTGTKKWSRGTAINVQNGAGSQVITPRHDGRFRLAFAGNTRLAARTSASRAFDNRPPGRVVAMPKGAARPTLKLPRQSRGSRARADAKITKISDAVWKSMVGRTWRKGCPVGRSSLRMVRVNYWAFDGYVRRGEIVVNKSVAQDAADVFTALFAERAPVRAMYRVDRFGYDPTLRGGDDMRSMRADNTSGFNCRRVVGRPSRLSGHSYGRSIDINPWENPFASREGYVPNKSWARRTSPAAVTYRGTSDPVVKIFAKGGFRWLGSADLHHFER